MPNIPSSLLDITSAYVATLDLNFRVREANTAFAARFERTPAELIGASLAEFVHPDDRGRMESLRSLLRRGEGPWRLSCRYLLPNREPFAIRWEIVASPAEETLFLVGMNFSWEPPGGAIHGSDGSRDAFLHLDPDLRIRYADRRAGGIFGVEPREVLGRSVEDVLPADARRVFRQECARAFASQTSVSFACFDHHGNWFEVVVYPVPAGLTVVMRDCTRRYVLEQRLIEQAETLEIVVGLGRRLTSELDNDRLIQDATNVLTEATGAELGIFLSPRGDGALAPQPAEVMAFSAIPSLDFTPGPKLAWEGLLDHVRSSRYWYRTDARNPNCAAAPVELERLKARSFLAVPLVSRSTELLGIVLLCHRADRAFNDRCVQLATGLASQAAIAIDNARLHSGLLEQSSQRMRLVEQLRETSIILESLIHSSPLGILMIDPKGLVKISNETAAAVLGHDWLPLVGKHVSQIPLCDAAGVPAPLLAQAIKCEAPVALESRYRRRDGSVAELSLSLAPVARPDRTRVGTVCLVADVTRERQMRAQLANADRLSSVGTLAAGILHEINNPLTYVLTNLSLALDEASDPSLRKLLEQGVQGAERMREIVRGLKTFSRNDDERPRPVDVRKVLESALAMASNEIWPRAELVCEYGDTPPVKGHEGKLGQVFVNLIINAAQSIPEGRALDNRITLRTRETGRSVVIEVSDTGCGIPETIRTRLFDPFFTTKPVGVGTGLGLSICHGIVSSMGGTIEVQSEVGKGALFRVILPVSDEPVVPDPAPSQTSAPTLPPAYPGGKAARHARVLIIDDERAVADGLCKILKRDQHEATAYTDSLKAFEALVEGDPYDLVFCDLMMPCMTGMELYERVKTERPGFEKRIVFMTGGAFTQSAQSFIQRTENLIIEKPFSAKSVRDPVLSTRAEDRARVSD